MFRSSQLILAAAMAWYAYGSAHSAMPAAAVAPADKTAARSSWSWQTLSGARAYPESLAFPQKLANRIGRLDAAGKLTEIPIPTP